MECIDILLATYNGEKYLKEQINSILSQSYSNFRLVISDDCSKDSTREILAEFKNMDNRIELHFQEKNLGFVRNFEFLLKIVKGKYYMLSDQDDVWDKDKVRISLEAIKREKAVLVFSDLLVVDENLGIINKSFWKTISVHRKVGKFSDYRMLYQCNCVTGCTILSESKYIERFLPFPKDSWIAHDYWMALILSQFGKLYAIDKPLIKYRQHGNNQIGAFNLKKEKNISFKVKRKKYINYKIEQFKVYCQNNEKFSDFLQKKNIAALKYFENVYTKEYFNFKGFLIFHFVFKNETFIFYLRNLIYLNFPIFLKIIKK